VTDSRRAMAYLVAPGSDDYIRIARNQRLIIAEYRNYQRQIMPAGPGARA